jgi:hypothetical protein
MNAMLALLVAASTISPPVAHELVGKQSREPKMAQIYYSVKCQTAIGACMMNAAQPIGSPCVCFSPRGPIYGQVMP